VAGDGPQFKELVEMAKIMKLTKIRFLGEVDSHQLEKLYVASDIVVIPSLIEAAGITALESMAYMKPLVAFDSGGLTEIIDENEVGIVVENRNIEQLSNKILELVESPSRRRKFSNNCMKNIGKYDWNKITKRIYELYCSSTRA
jgi:glycosyltransferase involved in cell wall biosynthesis